MNQVTYIYYTHPLMIKSIFNEDIRNYINEQVGTDWQGFTTNVDLSWYRFITNFDEDDDLTNQFQTMTSGVCLEQYKQIQEGGTYVNPMLIGILNDYENWCKFIQESFGYNTVFKPLYIPYEYFEPVFDEFVEEIKAKDIDFDEEDIPEKMTKEEYDSYFTSVETIVHALNVEVSVPKEYDVSQRMPVCGTA